MDLARSNGCLLFQHCASCLFDGYDVQSRVQMQCSWNESSRMCTKALVNFTGRSQQHAHCEDLPCGLAKMSSNVYICDGWGEVVFAFNIFFLVLCGLHLLWVWVLGQTPWCVDQRLISTAIGGFFRLQHVSLPNSPMARVLSPTSGDPLCSHCELPKVIETENAGKILQARQRTCVWCIVQQHARYPIIVCLACVSCSLTCLLGVSLPTFFALTYHMCLLCVVFITFALYYAYSYSLLRIHGRRNPADPYYLRLTIVMVIKMCSLQVLIGEIPGDEELGSRNSPRSSENSVSRSTPANADHYLKPLPDVFSRNFTARDSTEVIVWWEKPSFTSLLLEKRCLFQVLVFIMLAVIPLFQVVSHWATYLVLATIELVISIVLVLILLSCDCAYILTTQRNVILSRSILWRKVHEQSQELITICCAAVLKYQDLHIPRTTVSFQHPSIKVGRRLPPLSNHKFTCVTDVSYFVKVFTQLAPPLDETHMVGLIQAHREEQSAYLFMSIVAACLVPIAMFYRIAFSTGQWVWLLVCLFGIMQATISSCERLFTTMVIRLHSAKYWSHWRRPVFNPSTVMSSSSSSIQASPK
eukprot:PhF_6_TR12913/c0_g1_i1/m.20355